MADLQEVDASPRRLVYKLASIEMSSSCVVKAARTSPTKHETVHEVKAVVAIPPIYKDACPLDIKADGS